MEMWGLIVKISVTCVSIRKHAPVIDYVLNKCRYGFEHKRKIYSREANGSKFILEIEVNERKQASFNNVINRTCYN